MEKQEFKEFLVKSLEDEEIIDKLNSINDICRSGKNYITDESLSKHISQIQDLSYKNRELNDEVKRLQHVESNFKKTSKELMQYKHLFCSLFQVLESYNGLSDKSKEALKGMFYGNAPEEFIVSGIIQGNIESLWEYSKIQIMKQEYEDIEKLNNIILYFIKLRNHAKITPLYEVSKTNQGEQFDVERHIRTPSSKPSGRIKNVILQGIKNNSTGIIVKKSVVEL